MPHHDLLKLAELALAGHVRPDLPEEVTRILVQASGARAGVLFNGDRRPEAWWPQAPTAPAADGGEGWTSIAVGHEHSRWEMMLHEPASEDETLLIAARLALHVWDLREALRQTKFDERFRLWELEAVRSIAQGLGGVLEPGAIAREVLGHVVSLLGVRNAEIVIGTHQSQPRVLAAFGDPVLDRPIPETIWLHGFRQPQAVAAALVGNGEALGLLAVSQKEARAGTAPFDDNDVRLIDLFAVQTAVALENARLSRASIEQARLQQEMEVAATIQTHLYPKESVEIPGVKVRTSFQPARRVGGDLFEIIERRKGLLSIVADVTGKGIGAGLIAAGLHAGIRLLAGEALSIETIARRLNAYLATATEDNRFATMVIVQMAPDGSFSALHAGHCPSLLRRAGGAVETIKSSGLPLGIVPEARYRSVKGRLDPGDLIVLYTDGLTEAENARGEELGIDRLREIVAALDTRDVETLCDQILAGVAAFAGDVPLADDATIVVLKKEASPSGGG
ncbi:MAG: SpoIIE family protein phosphatase [Acidobacteria bacterium]|nr:SpoIIE family protein phosphatase [Acidobacteriota bacterium]